MVFMDLANKIKFPMNQLDLCVRWILKLFLVKLDMGGPEASSQYQPYRCEASSYGASLPILCDNFWKTLGMLVLDPSFVDDFFDQLGVTDEEKWGLN